MTNTDIWQLTISYWPNATENNIRPVKCQSFYVDQDYQGYYSPDTFLFDSEPSRQDFSNLVAQLPYMHNQPVLPVLAANDWPIVGTGYKAASVDLLDDKIRVVGRVDVNKQSLYAADSYPYVGIDVATEQNIVNRLPKTKRDAAKQLILHKKNFILEQTIVAGESTQETVAYVIRCLLHQSGLLKSKPRHHKGIRP